MGCFLGCFGASDDRKHKKPRYKLVHRRKGDRKLPKIQNLLKAHLSLDQNGIKERSITQVPESRENTEVPLSLKRRKRVRFDTNVTTYEHVHVYDSTESLLEKNEKGETFPKSTEPHFQSDANSKDNSVALRTNYRYENCQESDEVEDLQDEAYDLDEDEEDLDDEERYDDDDNDEERYESSALNTIGSNRNDRVKDGYVLSVLNPVENVTQWKALKSKGSTRKPLSFIRQKENLASNILPPESKNPVQGTAVDASLSNWLISSENITRNYIRVQS